MPLDLPFASATRLASAIRAREVSSREVLDHLLSRVEQHNPDLNAVVALDVDRAREDAARRDAETARGESVGPLHGVPLTIKDVWETAGLVTTSGAPALKDHVPVRDAESVARLRRAGAVVFGKTNVPLYAADVQSANEVYGRTNNPWALDRTPGGSSGGAAAAVAAGLTPIELGSDIGGSIRNPAHFCGIHGFKPSWGVVPQQGHIPGPPGSLGETDVSCPGPLARSVEDLSLVFDAIVGPAPADAGAWRLELPPADAGSDRDTGVRGLRLALVPGDPDLPVNAATTDRLRAFADRLADAGAIVEERPLPVSGRESFALWQELVLPIIGLTLPDEVYQQLAAAAVGATGDDPASRGLRGLVTTYRDWARADQARLHAMARWQALFTEVDAVLAPVMPTEAFPHDTERSTVDRNLDVDGESVWYGLATGWCGSSGVVRLPVVTLPTGLTPGGLPVGVQVIGPHLHDLRLLALADRLDAVAAELHRPPGY
jgi:amidase